MKHLLFILCLAYATGLSAQTLVKADFEQDRYNVKINYYMQDVQEGQRFDVEILCSYDAHGC